MTTHLNQAYGVTDQSHAGAYLSQLDTVAPQVDPIWTKVAALAEGKEHVRILFTSAENQAGTSLISAATATSLARNLRAKVLLMEANMSQPSVASYLGLDGVPGLSDLFLGHTDIESAVRPVPGVPDLHVLPGGSPRAAIDGEFATSGARNLIDGLTRRSKFTVIDSPPLIHHAEARSLLSSADACVIVMQARVTLKAQAAKLAQLIEGARVPILGVVLNRHATELGFRSGDQG